MRSVYIIGGAGTGKSTFTAGLLDRMGAELGPLEDLDSAQNAKALVTLRGHWATPGRGLYLGCMRDSFPGTDGLDRASSPVGEKWLSDPAREHPDWLLSEGATLATRRFIHALDKYTDLLLLYLVCDPEIVRERCAERGSSQAEAFIKTTVTRSANLAFEMQKEGATVIECDTVAEEAVDIATDVCAWHLLMRK